MKIGHVYLVGAGCGKGLITLRGLELIRRADAIVYDDLIDASLINDAPAGCVTICMGKRCGRKSAGQQEINEKLYALASSGLLVVRLKGGDPFVFGRGGEEYQYLHARGIPCTAVPGVSSCIAVPEEAGIPVTNRGSAGSFTVVTGHSAGGNHQDYRSLAALDGTLVFLMGLRSCGEIAEELMRYGKNPETPASIISRGFTPDEKRIDGTLSDIAQNAAGAETPAVLVIGPNAAFAFSDREDVRDETPRPLSGKTAAVLGSAAFTDKVRKKLSELGCRVSACPILRVQEREETLPDFRRYSHIVFTSSNGIRIFFRMMQEQGRDLRELMHAKFAVIGSATAQTLYTYGIRADLVPDVFTSRALGEKLAAAVENAADFRIGSSAGNGAEISTGSSAANSGGKDNESCDGNAAGARVLILRSPDGSEELTRILAEHRIAYDEEDIYETVIDETKMPGQGEYSYVIFGSSKSVRAYFEGRNPGADAGSTRFVCIGEVCARTLRSLCHADMIVASDYTADGIVRAITREKHSETR